MGYELFKDERGKWRRKLTPSEPRTAPAPHPPRRRAGARHSCPGQTADQALQAIRDRSVGANGGCLLWTGACTGSGYGATTVLRRFRAVHRLAWEAVNGPLPEGRHLHHVCGNRLCVNPEHITAPAAKAKPRSKGEGGDGRPRRVAGNLDPRAVGLGPVSAAAAARFMERVRVSEDDCWLWLGACRPRGDGQSYGSVHVGRTTTSAHRLSYAIHHGGVPAGMSVLHKCDNTLCVRPDHLFLGTQRDNVRDMIAKGRANPFGGHVRRGTEIHTARLTAPEVAAIKARLAQGTTYRALAREYGVSMGAIGEIARGKNWRHVEVTSCLETV